MTAADRLARGVRWLRELETRTRPVDHETETALHRRWEELPEAVRTPAQLLGRRSSGCEGTHGVFPRCDLACAPCYHAREANQVRADGPHTVREIDAQMAFLNQVRGAGQHAQLIGGEVTLLGPENHAAGAPPMKHTEQKPRRTRQRELDSEHPER
ncbi:MAG: radical SAM domain-containing protein, partial [Solirubrobacteraceae bacterium]